MSVGLQVVPVKHTFMEWGYVIIDDTGRVVGSGNGGPNGGPLVRKGAAKAAGADTPQCDAQAPAPYRESSKEAAFRRSGAVNALSKEMFSPAEV